MKFTMHELLVGLIFALFVLFSFLCSALSMTMHKVMELENTIRSISQNYRLKK